MGRGGELAARAGTRDRGDHRHGTGVPLGAGYDELIEQDFGAAEGTLVAELATRWPDRDFADKEPDHEVGPRGIRGLELIARDHPGARVLAVAHGTLIRHTLAVIPVTRRGSTPSSTTRRRRSCGSRMPRGAC